MMVIFRLRVGVGRSVGGVRVISGDGIEADTRAVGGTGVETGGSAQADMKKPRQRR